MGVQSGDVHENNINVMNSSSEMSKDFGLHQRRSQEQALASKRPYMEGLFTASNPYISYWENPDIYPQWYKMLDQFGNRKLSFADDALPALSGVAAEFAVVTGDIYLGGIWKGGLLWSHPVGSSKEGEKNRDGDKPSRSTVARSDDIFYVPELNAASNTIYCT